MISKKKKGEEERREKKLQPLTYDANWSHTFLSTSGMPDEFIAEHYDVLSPMKQYLWVVDVGCKINNNNL